MFLTFFIDIYPLVKCFYEQINWSSWTMKRFSLIKVGYRHLLGRKPHTHLGK